MITHRYKTFTRLLVLITIVSMLALSVLNTTSSAQTVGFSDDFQSLHNQRVASTKAIPAGAVLIFVAGIVVGYFIDGVIVYNTGHSAAELTAKGIKKIKAYIKKHPNVKKVYYNKKTGKVGSGTGGGGGGSWK